MSLASVSGGKMVDGLLPAFSFDIFRAKMKTDGRTYFSLEGSTVTLGPSCDLSGMSVTIFMKDLLYILNFSGH